MASSRAPTSTSTTPAAMAGPWSSSTADRCPARRSTTRCPRCSRPATASSPTIAAASAAATSPKKGYSYDTLAEDLQEVLTELDLDDATVVGFSMGGGEVARYCAKYGAERLRSVVFASAVPPYLLQTDDNPDGPLSKEQAAEMTAGLTEDEDEFYDGFTKDSYPSTGRWR